MAFTCGIQIELALGLGNDPKNCQHIARNNLRSVLLTVHVHSFLQRGEVLPSIAT